MNGGNFYDREITFPITADPHYFIREKVAAVLFGKERVKVKSWREAFEVILKRCNQDSRRHEALMYLRDKALGKCRTFLSASPSGMTRPIKIDDDMYAEVHYGTETLLHILVNRILAPAGFDYSDISVAMRVKTPGKDCGKQR